MNTIELYIISFGCQLIASLCEIYAASLRVPTCSDLIRLLVETRRKELVTRADPEGNIGTYSTLEPPDPRNEKAGIVGASSP
ncbi:hypothetical protein H9L39_17643 [Fusarium oxysporum f. sp. albedinis]|nr:hypothetical protein H9L39_17643 [Fusarium oxysporum f. sp. albedinis]